MTENETQDQPALQTPPAPARNAAATHHPLDADWLVEQYLSEERARQLAPALRIADPVFPCDEQAPKEERADDGE